MASEDPILTHLRDELGAIDQRREAIVAAMEALTGSAPVTRRRSNATVGEDKLEAVRAYIAKRRGEYVRQADITKALGLNSGTVSVATVSLMLAGEIEEGPKRDRSKTYRAVK